MGMGIATGRARGRRGGRVRMLMSASRSTRARKKGERLSDGNWKHYYACARQRLLAFHAAQGMAWHKCPSRHWHPNLRRTNLEPIPRQTTSDRQHSFEKQQWVVPRSALGLGTLAEQRSKSRAARGEAVASQRMIASNMMPGNLTRHPSD